MHILEQLGVALGLASLAGINLYLTVLLAGLAVRFDWLHLAAQHQSLEVLGHPVVLFVAGILFCLEFFADKVPWMDSLWDSVHTFIRPVGGVLLGLQAVGDMPIYVQVAAALLAGGAAMTTHGAKAGTRLLVNQSPEPVSNVAVSLGEDVAVTGGVALTLMNPLVALITFGSILLILWMVLPRLWRASKATVWLVWRKLRMPGLRRASAQSVELDRKLNDDLRDLLQLQAGVDENDVLATVPCLSGKGRGVRGLSGNLPGLLVLTNQPDMVHFAASKGLSDRVFRLPLAGVDVQTDSQFLSENLVLEGSSFRAVFRFPRGEGDTVETLAQRLSAGATGKSLEAPAAATADVAGDKKPIPLKPVPEPDAPTTPMMRPLPTPAAAVKEKVRLTFQKSPTPVEPAVVAGPAPAPLAEEKLTPMVPEPLKKMEDVPPTPPAGVAESAEVRPPLSSGLKPMVFPRPDVSSEVVLRPMDDPPAIAEAKDAPPPPVPPAPLTADLLEEESGAKDPGQDKVANEEVAETSPNPGGEPKKESLPAFPAIQ